MIKHILGWLIFTLLTIFALPALVTPSSFVTHIKREQGSIEETFGEQSAQKIIGVADGMYKSIFEDSGFHESFIKKFAIPEQDILANKTAAEDPLAKDPTTKYTRYLQSYFVGLFISFYEWMFRIVQLLMWILLALPFLLASVVDGLMQRKVRTACFIYTSPTMFSGLWHGLIAMVFGVNWILNIPFNIKPLIYPFVIVMFAMLIRTLISNIQRSA